jgi:hypothetical protein
MIPDQSKELKAMALRYQIPIFPALNFSAGWQEYLVLSEIKTKNTIGIVLNADTIRFNFAFEKSEFIGQDNQYYFSVDLNF